MLLTERRIVEQDWYETETTRTGWDSYGWVFKDSGADAEVQGWWIVETLDSDKFGNPILAIAEKETEILFTTTNSIQRHRKTRNRFIKP